MTSHREDLNRLRRRAVGLCILTTALVAGTEITIGVMFDLISISAEGLHTLADLGDSVVALLLMLVASQPADKKHPYGHGKYDSLAGMVEGLFVAGAGIYAVVKAAGVLMGWIENEPMPSNWAVLAMIAAGVVYLLVSRHVFQLAKRTQSPLVYAEAMHLSTHIYITIGLVAGLFLTRLGQHLQWASAGQIDSLVALVLGVYLIGVAVRIIKPALAQLMDTALSGEETREIVEVLNEFRNQFVEVHAVRTRRSGMEKHVDIHLMVPADTSVEDAHHLSHRIEERLLEKYPNTRLLVHVEPAAGRAWEEYLQRERVGIVFGEGLVTRRDEAGHHRSRHAHPI